MTIYKFPFEQFGISIDFAADIGLNGTIASISAVTATSRLSGQDTTQQVIATWPAPAIQGTAVSLTVMDGNAGESHTIRAEIVSGNGEKYQGEINLVIQQ